MLSLLFFWGDAQAEDSLCVSQQLAQRAGRQSCWVYYSVNSEKRVCISKKAWLNRTGLQFCGISQKKWKIYSPPQNDLYFNEKKIFKTVEIDRLNSTNHHPGNQLYVLFLDQIEKLRDQISSHLARSDFFGIFRKLILNENVSQSQIPLMRQVGFVHLVTEAGIHFYAIVRLFSGFAFLITRHLGLPFQVSFYGSRVLSFILFLFLWILSGMRVGMLRPICVISLRMASVYFGFKWKTYSPLLIAIFCDVLMAFIMWAFLNEKFWSPGRIHYALAVGGGLWGIEVFQMYYKKKNAFKLLHEHFVLSVCSWAFTATLDAIHLGMIASFTPLLSLLTIPLFTVLVLPMIVLFWSEPLIHPVLIWCNEFILKLFEMTLLGGGVVSVNQSAMLIAALCSTFFIFNKKRAVVVLIALLSFRIFMGPMNLMLHKNTIEQLDVGQGDSALVRVNQSVGLIDTGSFWAMNEISWLKLFIQRQVSSLDYVVISHFDEDHFGALRRLIGLIPIGCVVSARQAWDQMKAKEIKRLLEEYQIKVGDWESGCFPFEGFLISDKKKKQNALMSATYVEFEDVAYLNFGDADQKDELIALSKLNERLGARGFGAVKRRILKLAHHGSRTSTPEPLLQGFQPTEAWVSSGVNNRFGHPVLEVLELVNRHQIPILRTDQTGVLSIHSRQHP